MGAMAVYRLAEMRPEDRRRMMERATAEIFDAALNEGVREIIEDVRLRGDEALVSALQRFDAVSCPADRLRVSEEEIATARTQVSEEVVRAIRQGITNIRAFNKRVLEGASWLKEVAPGLVMGEQARPVESAALFVPSGKGSFPSVLMQIGTPAVVAGVPQIVVIVPPCGRTGDRRRSRRARGRGGARPHRSVPFQRPGGHRCGCPRH